MAANPLPDMNFDGLVHHPEACTAIRLEGNRALLAKNHVLDTNLNGTMSANPLPDMNFGQVLRFQLSLGGLVHHPGTCTAKQLEGNQALLAKNHVVESVSTLQHILCELQPLDFVGISNQLAIGGPLQSPASLLS